MSLAAPYQEHYYVADGVTTSFAFGEDFTALSAANVKCIIYFEDGTNCVPTFTVDMTTGFITIVTLTKPDGTVLTVPPVGSIVRVFRDTPEQQNVTASQLQNYTAKQLERIFDSVVAMIQEVSYSDLHKTIRLTETQRDVSMEQLKEENDQAILYWDFETRQLKATDYGQNQVVKSDTVDRLVYLQPEGKIYFIPKGSNNPIAIGSATIHNDLSGRNAPDCHPESAITGLTTHLQELRDRDTAIEYKADQALSKAGEALTTANNADANATYAVGVVNTFDGRLTQAESDASEAKEKAIDAKTTVDNHVLDYNNPHQVTNAQVGLGNVDNTSDLDKPISTATQTALELKANSADLATVATSGSYTDLINKPTIGDATLIIQKNGTTIDSFTANATTDKTINITVPVTASDVNALPDTTKYVANASMTINSTTYVLTLQLKDQDGNNIGTAQTIDLPLESVVVSGSYDSATKEVVLTLQNGSTIRFSVADLVSGLQTEITVNNMLNADLVDDSTSTNKFVTSSDITTWNAKQDALTAGSNITISGTTISATDTTYTGSDGITLTGTNFTNSGVRSVATGSTNGTISVNTNGTSADVAVYGLGSAAYTASTSYATSAQGAKADTALQPGDNVSELINDAGYLTQHQTLADLGITATASEINVLDGITATTTELNYVDGVTSNIQTQLNSKAADADVVHKTGNETIDGTKTFNETLQLKSNLSFRSYGSNDSGRLQFRAQPSDNVIRGTVAITDGYSTAGSGYNGFVAQLVARAGSTTSDPFNTIRVSNKGIEYIQEANDGTITGQYIIVDNYGLIPSARLAASGSTGQVLTKTATGQDWETLAVVATSGSYNDLSNKPIIPAAQVNSDWNAVSGVSQILNKPTLATVATSGSYTDLSNKPTLGTMAAENASDYTKTSGLAAVATSGSYNDLSNKPTIPTTLAALTGDVSISSPTGGQVLQYDANLNKWKNSTSTVSIGFDGVTGSPYDNVALKSALDAKANSTDLATVATSGSYNDLSNKPTIPAAQVNSDWNAVSGVAQILNKPTLATVATSGSYNDLSNKPTIPASQVNSDWDAVSGVAQILNKPTLATVATSGSYNDLSNKPTIPTVGDGTITITQGGVTKGTFTTNQGGNTTVALDAGTSYTAGDGIDITSNTISVDDLDCGTM